MTKNQQPDREVDARFTSLERRVAALEARLGDEPPRLPAPTPDERWRVVANWRSGIRLGASESDVRRALGEPRKIKGGDFTDWYYSKAEFGSFVRFYKGKVHSWNEPG